MQRFTLAQLSYFVKTASVGSLSLAARNLHVSQPSISAAISHIEQALGYPLLTRHNRYGVKLTAEGTEFFEQARHILALVDELGSQKTGDREALVGQVSVGCFEPLAAFHLPALMRSISKAYPNIKVRYDVRSQPQLHSAIVSGELSLAISYDTGVWEDVASITIGHVSPFAIVAVDHKLASQPEVSLRQLSGEDYILIDWPESKQYQLGLFSQGGLVPNVVHYATNLEMLRGMVANGIGVSISVTRPVGDRSYDGKAIACLRISDPIAPQRIVLCYASERNLTRAGQAVLEQIVEAFAGHSQ
jgi:DNA-binding transcriptional LysR family regulator